jgi:hypothetical protein
MQVLDRYLAAVARRLPKDQAGDITAELRDNLLSEIEEKEAGLGRKLKPRELDALLIGFGHPLAVAARYGQPRYLIGPELYPFWFATLRVVFAIFAAIVVVGLVIAAASGQLQSRQVAQGLGQLWPTALMVFAIVTLVFAVLERAWKGKVKLNWSPRQLPTPRRRGRKPIEILSQMVADVVVILWWVGLIHFRDFTPIPPFIQVHLAPVWATLFWPILAYNVAEFVFGAVELARPGWVRGNTGLSLAKGLGGCAIAAFLLQAGHWIEVDAPVSAHALQSMRHGFDQGMQIGLIATLAVVAVKALWDGWRLIQGPGARNGASSSAAASAA